MLYFNICYIRCLIFIILFHPSYYIHYYYYFIVFISICFIKLIILLYQIHYYYYLIIRLLNAYSFITFISPPPRLKLYIHPYLHIQLISFISPPLIIIWTPTLYSFHPLLYVYILYIYHFTPSEAPLRGARPKPGEPCSVYGANRIQC